MPNREKMLKNQKSKEKYNKILFKKATISINVNERNSITDR